MTALAMAAEVSRIDKLYTQSLKEAELGEAEGITTIYLNSLRDTLNTNNWEGKAVVFGRAPLNNPDTFHCHLSLPSYVVGRWRFLQSALDVSFTKVADRGRVRGAYFDSAWLSDEVWFHAPLKAADEDGVLRNPVLDYFKRFPVMVDQLFNSMDPALPRLEAGQKPPIGWLDIPHETMVGEYDKTRKATLHGAPSDYWVRNGADSLGYTYIDGDGNRMATEQDPSVHGVRPIFFVWYNGARA